MAVLALGGQRKGIGWGPLLHSQKRIALLQRNAETGLHRQSTGLVPTVGYRSKPRQRNVPTRLQFRLSFSSVALGESLEAFHREVSSFISKWLD